MGSGRVVDLTVDYQVGRAAFSVGVNPVANQVDIVRCIESGVRSSSLLIDSRYLISSKMTTESAVVSFRRRSLIECLSVCRCAALFAACSVSKTDLGY